MIKIYLISTKLFLKLKNIRTDSAIIIVHHWQYLTTMLILLSFFFAGECSNIAGNYAVSVYIQRSIGLSRCRVFN